MSKTEKRFHVYKPGKYDNSVQEEVVGDYDTIMEVVEVLDTIEYASRPVRIMDRTHTWNERQQSWMFQVFINPPQFLEWARDYE